MLYRKIQLLLIKNCGQRGRGELMCFSQKFKKNRYHDHFFEKKNISLLDLWDFVKLEPNLS